MDLQYAISRMEHYVEAIAVLFDSIDEAQARWKPSPEDWSLLEVICHLYDEECEDFRNRVDILLHRQDDPWPSIDPPGWVTERKYNERDPQAAIQNFLRERQQSLAWLQSLQSPDWTSTGPTPWELTMSAGQMLHCWLAHDMLHLRQMVELHYKYIEAAAAPDTVEYAGGW